MDALLIARPLLLEDGFQFQLKDHVILAGPAWLCSAQVATSSHICAVMVRQCGADVQIQPSDVDPSKACMRAKGPTHSTEILHERLPLLFSVVF